MEQNKDASVEELKREKEATALLISGLEKFRHELQKSKRALQAKNTHATLSKAKVASHAIDLEQKLDLAVQVTSMQHLKDKGIVNDNAWDMIRDLVQCNIPVKYVAKAIASGKRGLVLEKPRLLWVSLETIKTSKIQRLPGRPWRNVPWVQITQSTPKALSKHPKVFPEHLQSIPRASSEHS